MRLYGQGEVTCHHPIFSGYRRGRDPLLEVKTNDDQWSGTEPETGGSLFADDVGKVKTNDDHG